MAWGGVDILLRTPGSGVAMRRACPVPGGGGSRQGRCGNAMWLSYTEQHAHAGVGLAAVALEERSVVRCALQAVDVVEHHLHGPRLDRPKPASVYVAATGDVLRRPKHMARC